jgi:hypothetical protein
MQGAFNLWLSEQFASVNQLSEQRFSVVGWSDGSVVGLDLMNTDPVFAFGDRRTNR